jgi:hypothetical protein
MAAIGKFFRRSSREILLATIAAAALLAVRLELKLAGFRHRRWIEEPGSPRRDGATANGVSAGIPADEIAWAVKAASVRIPGATNCLVRALALKYLLNLFGHESRLRIGAGHPEDGRFEAHAWVESGGRILIGEFDRGHYAPFPTPETPPTADLQ